MKRFDSRVLWGILLVVVGSLFLLENFGIFGSILGLIWPLLFAVAGATFFYVFLTNRAHWWAVIPGFALLGLAATTALDRLFPRLGGMWGGALFLGAIALSFLVVYVTGRDRWWAIIPGGVLLTSALTAGLSSTFGGLETGGIFFLGLGLTFGLLAFLPTPQGRMKWALIPAVVLLVMGLLITAASSALLPFLGSAALILAGLYLVLRAFGFRSKR